MTEVPSVDDQMAEANLTGDERSPAGPTSTPLMEEAVPFVPYVFDNNVDITSQRVVNYTFDQFAGLAAWDKMPSIRPPSRPRPEGREPRTRQEPQEGAAPSGPSWG